MTLPAPALTPQTKASRSILVSRNITIASHRTSVRLEPEMWSGLGDICRRERASLNEVCSVIAACRPDNSSLTAAIRVFVMAYFRAAATEDGHSRVGHGRGAAMLNQPVAPALMPALASNGPAHNPHLMGYPTIGPGSNPAHTAPNRAHTQPPSGKPIPFMIGQNRLNGR